MLHGNLRSIVKILDRNRQKIELGLTINMLMTAACFFYSMLAPMESDFEKILWLGATICFSAITVFIFGLFLGMTWAKKNIEDLKER